MTTDEKRKQEAIEELIDFAKKGGWTSINVPASLVDAFHANWLEENKYKVSCLSEHNLYFVSWAHWQLDPDVLQPNTYFNQDTGYKLPQSGY